MWQWRYRIATGESVEGLIRSLLGRGIGLATHKCPHDEGDHDDADDHQEDRVPAPPLIDDSAPGSDQQDPPQRHRDKDLPAQIHEVVVAEPRDRGAHPHEEEDDDLGLEEEPQQAPPA